MSYDVFFQGFLAGESSGTGAAAMDRGLAPYVVERRGSFRHLRVGDGSADAYVNDVGMLANHISGVDLWEVLVEGARAANWVILPMDAPTCLTCPGQLEELPDGLGVAAVSVSTGADVLQVLPSH